MKVGESMAITDEKTLTDMASKFYTALTMDGRFVLLENNTWVLRQLICFEDVHIDMNDVYSGDEDEDSDEDEDETHAEKEADDDVAEEGEVKDETEEKETDDDVPVPSADDDDDTIA
jgi:DNA-directed RNA polymerase delta subunit